MDNSNFILISVVALLIVLLYKISQYIKKIDNKNMQLMQFHLDSKFMHKGLIQSLRSSDSKKFCIALMQQIKDYYNLEEIIIVDSVKMMGKDKKSITKGAAINFLREDIEPMLRMLSSHELKKFNITSDKRNYILYISRLAIVEDSDGVVICVENVPSLLGKNEKRGLENCINLLKNRLLYD